VYCRADLSRTAVLVVALLLAAVSTAAFAREICVSDPRGGSHPAPEALRGLNPGSHISRSGAEQERSGSGAIRLDRTNVALIRTMTPLLVWRHRNTERI
jgi:hypothetical protein